MRKLNRMIAVILASVMFCLMPVTDMNVMAEEISDTTVTENDSYQMEKGKIEGNTETDSEQLAQNEAPIEQESEDQGIISNGLLNYVGIDKPYLTSPDTQKIVVSYGDGTEPISEAKIVYQKADGTILEDQMSSRQEELFLFEHSFLNEDKGTYTLLQFVYVENGVEQTIELQDIGIGAMFGVDEEYPGYGAVESDDEVSSEEVEMSVVDMNANEVNTVQGDIETAIEDTADAIETTSLGNSGKSIGGRYIMSKKLSKQKLNDIITYGIVIAAFIIMQILINAGEISSLFQGLMVPLCTYIILAISLNLVVGILGELSLGHAGFMCVGAFTSSFFSKATQDTITNGTLRFFIALLIGIAVAAIFGIIIGIPVLRLNGDYLAIVTLAFGEIIKNLVNVLFIGKDSKGFHFSTKDAVSLNLEPDGKIIVNGPQGITGTPNDSTFFIGFILILITLFIVLNLIHSRDGRAIMAIRDNRIAAESIGINITKYKLMTFTISAAMAGAAGVLYAHNLSNLTANTNNFGYNMSINILVFVVLGGIGNIRGSVIAAVVLTLLPELLRGMSDYRMLIYAIVLIVMMLFNWAPKAIEWREKHLSFKKNKKEAA